MNKYFAILVITFFLFIPNISFAQGFGGFGFMRPFGGQVMTVQPCNTGLLIYVKTPMTGVMPFMWLTGNLPYLMRIPPHPGQYVLGMAGTVVPCVLGIVPMGAGPVILFHGSGI